VTIEVEVAGFLAQLCINPRRADSVTHIHRRDATEATVVAWPEWTDDICGNIWLLAAFTFHGGISERPQISRGLAGTSSSEPEPGAASPSRTNFRRSPH
jgi:hypothetical protein